MFKNILIATDGSDLAAKAVEQGIRFAKEIGAKITAVTVTEPFHFLSLAPSELEYTPIGDPEPARVVCDKPLTAAELRAILGETAARIFHIDCSCIDDC